MMIAAHPITGTRKNGHLLPITTFKKEIDKLFKPHKLEKELDKFMQSAVGNSKWTKGNSWIGTYR